MMKPTSILETKDAILELPNLTPIAGGSKPALSNSIKGFVQLDVSALSGVLEYRPEEFTFTALASTPLTEIQALLDKHDQYMPFDPPLAESGATIGGTLAAGLSGPGRYQYGGVRDFVLGVQFVTGSGELVRAGGKVVKNAAGFDLPKLLVGSIGRLGVITEVSFKVFPKPDTYVTACVECRDLKHALDCLTALTARPLDLAALDLIPPSTLCVRLAGFEDVLPERLKRVYAQIGNGDCIQGQRESAMWEQIRDFGWVDDGWSLIKIPITPIRIASLERELSSTNADRRYSAGGNLAWLAWSEGEDKLDTLLQNLGLLGLRILGKGGYPFLGARSQNVFARRVKQALDPQGRFAPII